MWEFLTWPATPGAASTSSRLFSAAVIIPARMFAVQAASFAMVKPTTAAFRAVDMIDVSAMAWTVVALTARLRYCMTFIAKIVVES